MISEITVAIKNGVRPGNSGAVIHACPTLAEAIHKTGERYNRTRLTPAAEKIMHA